MQESVIKQHGKITYSIRDSENLDYGFARRHRYFIEVPLSTTDREVLEVLNLAVTQLQKVREVDALSVNLYLSGVYDLPYAIANWAPNGKWSSAKKGTPKHLFSTHTKIHKEYRPKRIFKRCDIVFLQKGTSISKNADNWYEESIIKKITKTTKATVLEVKLSALITRVKVETFGKHATGWVSTYDIE